MPTGAEGEGGQLWGYVVLLLGAIGAVVGNFARAWLKGGEQDASVKAQTVVLERADLANLGDVQRMIADLRPRLEQVYDVERINRATLEGNQERMDEMLRIMRRLEVEQEVGRRVREEDILRLRVGKE